MTTQELLEPWDQSITLEFLNCYKNEPLIWDPKHRYHKSKKQLIAAWNRIHEAMREGGLDISVQDLKRKKESLMATYRMLRKQIKKDPTYEPTWFAYQSMSSFLHDVYYPENPLLKTKKDRFTQQSTSDHEYITPLKRSRFTEKVVQRHDPKLSNISTNSSRDNEEMDECELYGMLLAKKLRRLNQNQRDIAMNKIDNIIFELKLKGSSQRELRSPLFILNNDSYEDDLQEEVNYEDDPIMKDEQ